MHERVLGRKPKTESRILINQGLEIPGDYIFVWRKFIKNDEKDVPENTIIEKQIRGITYK